MLIKRRWGGTALFIIMLFILICVQCKKQEINQGRFTAIIGSVRLNGAPAVIDSRVKAGDVIATDPDSTATIQFGDIAILSLRSNSSITVSNIILSNSKIDIQQHLGKTFNKIRKNSNYTIATPTVVAAVRGTSFALNVDKDTGKTRLSVLSGTVGISKSEGQQTSKIRLPEEMRVNEGFGIDIVPDATLSPSALAVEEKNELSVLDSIEFVSQKVQEPSKKGDAPSGSESDKKTQTTIPANEVRNAAAKTYKEKLEEIKNMNSGKLDLITLNSGREIVGMIIERGLMYKIRTPNGTITIPRNEVSSQTITY